MNKDPATALELLALEARIERLESYLFWPFRLVQRIRMFLHLFHKWGSWCIMGKEGKTWHTRYRHCDICNTLQIETQKETGDDNGSTETGRQTSKDT